MVATEEETFYVRVVHRIPFEQRWTEDFGAWAAVVALRVGPASCIRTGDAKDFTGC